MWTMRAGPASLSAAMTSLPAPARGGSRTTTSGAGPLAWSVIQRSTRSARSFQPGQIAQRGPAVGDRGTRRFHREHRSGRSDLLGQPGRENPDSAVQIPREVTGAQSGPLGDQIRIALRRTVMRLPEAGGRQFPASTGDVFDRPAAAHDHPLVTRGVGRGTPRGRAAPFLRTRAIGIRPARRRGVFADSPCALVARAARTIGPARAAFRAPIELTPRRTVAAGPAPARPRARGVVTAAGTGHDRGGEFDDMAHAVTVHRDHQISAGRPRSIGDIGHGVGNRLRAAQIRDDAGAAIRVHPGPALFVHGEPHPGAPTAGHLGRRTHQRFHRHLAFDTRDPAQLLGDHRRLQRPLRRRGREGEIAASRSARPRDRTGRGDAIGEARRISTASPRQNDPPRSSVTRTRTSSPGRPCRTNTTRPSCLPTQNPPCPGVPSSTSKISPRRSLIATHPVRQKPEYVTARAHTRSS